METMVLAPQGADCSAVLGEVVEAVGDPGFAVSALCALSRLLPVGSWSVYELWPGREPQLHASAAQGRTDTTRDCFGAYRDQGLYRTDRSFDPVREQPAGVSVLLRLHADELPNPDHRAAIYQRYGMAERVSLAWQTEQGSLRAINLYRHGRQRAIDRDAIGSLVQAAPLLRAAVQRHLALSAGPRAEPGPPKPQATRLRLRQHCAELTERELDVLERLLAGLTYDGIAADTGLSLSSVKTYRERAFRRLGLSFRNQLFALFSGTC
jgi:DNA-binding CsgD family transcriptional regulator